jgi:CRISPR-associated endonuclease/helicase Cas3
MNTLAHTDFPTFFHAVWGFDPFPWQADLLERLATGKDPRRDHDGEPGLWPDVLDLPTGSGKTAALDIAVFHLALEADKKEQRRAPIRIAFVVDRRLIVDDAFTRAQHLSDVLAWSLLSDAEAKGLETSKPDLVEVIHRVRAAPVVRQVAGRLCWLAGSGQLPLVARPLRGGAPREDDWARTPVQPTILCSTVDQVGSRLLFRGYGVSDRMKPIHAGLLGSDCLILLDEAHLSEPFRQTLEAVKRLRAPDVASFGFAVLTATPSQQESVRFALSPADKLHPVLSRRIMVSKPALLIEIAGKQGVDTESRRAEGVTEQTQSVLGKLQAAGVAHPAVGVVVNRVARARAVFERLETELKDTARVILLIGPARGVDRDQLAQELEPIRTRHPDATRELSKPLVIVATQTIEAGVDIDFDGLVTEAAAFDALKQRFGRLNRAGRKIRTEAVILAHMDDIGAKADDPVYGDRIRATWEKLQQLATESDGIVDFGVKALREQTDLEEAEKLAAPRQDAPVLMPAYADLWSQTSPIPNADPEVALFLHGPDRSGAKVQIVWRADIDEQSDLRPAMNDSDERERLVELFKLVPPRAAEAIEVPLWAARAWLEQTGVNQADFSDTVERGLDTDDERGAGRRAFRWAGEDKTSQKNQRGDSGDRGSRAIYASKLRNGDLIVVPAAYGGCDQWGWSPKASGPVLDVADRAAVPYRTRRFAVRVTPALIAQERKVAEPLFNEAALSEELATCLAEHESDRRPDDILAAVLSLAILPEALRSRLEKFQRADTQASERQERRRGTLVVEFDVYGRDAEQRPRGVVFVAPRGLSMGPVHDLAAMPATESEELGSVADEPIQLVDHCIHVRDWADQFATRAGLASMLCDDIALCGYLHDPGKADPRYQAYYAGGDPFGPDLIEPLAKSGQKRLPRGAWERAGLPPDWRHEALSVRLAMLLGDLARAHDPELVLWLIGTHHGYGRPFFPHADPRDAENRFLDLPPQFGGKLSVPASPGPQSLAFDFNGQDWAQLFARLKHRYGIWGLARLEAFVRLADHQASEEGESPKTTEHYKEAAE